MTRGEAEAFLELPDRSRTAALRGMTPTQREFALVAIVVALSRPDESEERLAA